MHYLFGKFGAFEKCRIVSFKARLDYQRSARRSGDFFCGFSGFASFIRTLRDLAAEGGEVAADLRFGTQSPHSLKGR